MRPGSRSPRRTSHSSTSSTSRTPPAIAPRVHLFFQAFNDLGTPEAREADRCTRWRWWPAAELPDATVPYAQAAINGIRAGRLYTEMGWP